MYDLIIRGGEVVDGTGAPRQPADIGVRDGLIAAISEPGTITEGAHTVDADGLIVAPGFVDIHTHYDAQLLWDSTASPSPLHGVTTVVGGNCGFSIAPLGADAADYLLRMLAKVEGIPIDALRAGVLWDWRTFGDYLNRLEGRTAVNAGFLVGHSALRRVVMGEAAVGQQATEDQIQGMARLLHESLEVGGLGFSSSQAPTHNDGDGQPVPSRFATRDELLTLSAVVRDHPGTTIEFIPTAGVFTDEHMDLMSSMSLAANRPLNWNLLAVDSRKPQAHLDLLAAGDYATERGARVVALTIPDALSLRLSLLSDLFFAALPGWREVTTKPVPERIEMLRQSSVRDTLRAGMATPEAALFKDMINWSTWTIAETFATVNDGLAGRTLGDVAQERGEDPFDTLLDIAIEDKLRTGFLPPASGNDDDSWRMRADVWRDPRAMIGASDAGAHLDMLAAFSYTTTLLGDGVRRRGLLSLEEAVHCLSDQPARLYGLIGRGRIKVGWHADFAVFDEARVATGPVHTRDDLPGGASRLYAEAQGMEHVIVNGVPIVRDNSFTGDLPGVVLRSGRDTKTVGVPAHAS